LHNKEFAKGTPFSFKRSLFHAENQIKKIQRNWIANYIGGQWEGYCSIIETIIGEDKDFSKISMLERLKYQAVKNYRTFDKNKLQEFKQEIGICQK
jgi:hypothetical protein